MSSNEPDRNNNRTKTRYFIELVVCVLVLSVATKWFYEYFSGLVLNGEDPLLLWNSWYHRKYRYDGLMLYTIGRWFVDSHRSIVLIVLLLLFMWRVRTDLSIRQYGWGVRGLMGILGVFACMLFYGITRLMLMPLLT